MRTFWNTKTHINGVEEETCTVSDSDGNSAFITEADWIEIGKMKGWVIVPDEEVVSWQ